MGPGCGSFQNDGDGLEQDLQITQRTLFGGELIILCPLAGLGQPYLLVGSLGRKGDYQKPSEATTCS